MRSLISFRPALAALTLITLLISWTNAEYFGMEILAEIAVLALLAMSLDLLAGYTGLVSLGHAALFGCGAYSFAVFTAIWGWPASLSMAAATLLTGLVSLVVGAVVTRVQGIFFIMITLAIGEMGYELVFKTRALGGDDGLAGIPRLDLSAIGVDLNDPGIFALTLILLVAVVYLLLLRLLGSPYGAVLTGLHDNAGRMRALGLPVQLYQTSIFAFSGALAGFAGTLSAQHTMFIAPQLLHWTTSGEVLVIAILGGLGTLVGPIIGAALITLLRHELSDLTDYWGLWLGLFLILVVMGGKNGVVGWLEAGWRFVARRGAQSKSTARRSNDAAG
ncbi:branched-chain amino acid ABC transporter permease [Pelagibius sp. Alg239-R121]|uniref:branched-chain amino acid ABC transporter permease n=1 Tax=Pelagibius sp. Alg239-R121 TaxID=2993448 RepID=UPI0024A63170|nr:branched-chain amino acid ABC transporter permease [Pelagibius sp. Alg239-R121]